MVPTIVSDPVILGRFLKARLRPSAAESTKCSRNTLSPIRRMVIAAILLTLVLPAGSLLSLQSVAQSAGVPLSETSDMPRAFSTPSSPTRDLLSAMSPSTHWSGAPEVVHASSALNGVRATEKNFTPAVARNPGGENVSPPHAVQPSGPGSALLSTAIPLPPPSPFAERPREASNSAVIPSGHGYSGGGGSEPAAPSNLTVSGDAVAIDGVRAPLVNSYGIGMGWEGVDASVGSPNPPDGGLAVGPSDVLQVVNLQITAWTKTGTLVATNNLNNMWAGEGLGADALTDPDILYDSFDGRYIMSIEDKTTAGFYVAVSATNFSSGSIQLACDGVNWYCNYPITGASNGIPSGDLVDQPRLGISSNLITVSGSLCAISTDVCSAGGMIWTFAKGPMLSNSGTYWQYWGPTTSWGLWLVPTKTFANSPVGYVVGELSSNIVIVNITGTPPAASIPTPVWTPAVTPFVAAVDAPQPGTSNLVNVVGWGSSGVKSALFDGVNINQATVVGCGNPVQDCIRITTTDVLSGGWVVQDFEIQSGSQFDYYPVLAEDASGDLAVEFATSDSTIYPSLAIAGQSWDASANTISGSSWLAQGTSPQTSTRYGDYFGAATDPSNPHSLWVEGEYTGNAAWNTWIANVGVAPTGVLGLSLTASQTTVDANQLVDFTLTSPSTQCAPGQADWCTWYVSGYTPTPDLCKQQGPTYYWSYSWPSPRTVYIGNTTYIDEYSPNTCVSYQGGTLQTQGITITIDSALTVPTPTVTNNPADIGQTVTFTASPSGGSGTYSTYTWSGLPTGCMPANSATITCAAQSTGTSSITVAVTDTNGNTVTSSPLSFNVNSAALTVPAPTASLPVVDAGQQVVTFTVSPSGGANSYSTYAWVGLPAGCATANSATITCMPTTASTNSIKVAVTDANGNTMTSTPLSFDVDPALMVGAPSGPTSGTIGTPVTFTTTGGSGGSGSYTYAWNGLPAGCLSANALTITCTPTGPNGTSIINISATDSNANRVYSAAHMFTLGPVLVVPTPTVSKASIDVNQSTTFTVMPTGGSGTYTTYVWNGLPTGCASASQASLTCTPTSATGTPFAVSVTVTDSSGNTNTSATVTFTVYRDPTVGTATSNVTSVDVGQPVTFTSAVPAGGSGGFRYAWSGLPAGCSSTATTVSCTPMRAGTSSVIVTVTDSNGYGVSSAALSFVTYALPTVTTPSSSVSVGTVGQAITFTTTGAGGSGGLTFVWTSSPTGLGCTASTIHIVTCTPTVAGSYSVTVTVNDTNGGKVSATLSSFAVLVASSLPSISSFSASPASIVLGAWTNFTVVASGGTGSLTYSYTGLPAGCASADTAMLACRATSAGTFTVTVTVTDQASHSATKSATLMVTTSSGGPTISSFTATPSTVNVGSPTQLKVSASGGSGTLSYAYTGLPGGCSSQDTASLSCTPNVTGTFTIKVFVNDSARHSVTSTTSLTVNSQKGGGGGGGTTYGGLSVLLLLLLVAVIVAVVVVVTVLGRRKKGGTTPAPAAPPMPPPPVQPLAPPPG